MACPCEVGLAKDTSSGQMVATSGMLAPRTRGVRRCTGLAAATDPRTLRCMRIKGRDVPLLQGWRQSLTDVLS